MKKIVSFVLILVMAFAVVACTPADTTKPNVIRLKGPTGMGMVYMMELDTYNFTLTSMPEDIVGKLSSGEADIAAMPINLASVLYNKLKGGLVMIAVNTLGVLSVVENGNTINSLADLEGKKVYATGKGSTPEYIISYLLEQAGVNVDIEYVAEHAELTAMLASGNAEIGIMPEPNISVALSKNSDLRVALSLTEQWESVCDATLVQGCIVVRREFLEAHESVVKQFLKDYAASSAKVNKSHSTSASMIADKGIVADKAAAERAIPNCNIVSIMGEEMKEISVAMFEVLIAQAPKSIGGSLPGDDFYYMP